MLPHSIHKSTRKFAFRSLQLRSREKRKQYNEEMDSAFHDLKIIKGNITSNGFIGYLRNRMELRIVHRSEIDTSKWDALIDATPESSLCSYSWWLDELAENWAAIVAGDYESVLALPYTVRLGQKILYTPIFCSYSEMLGKEMDVQKCEALILSTFKTIQYAVLQPVFRRQREQWVCQRATTDAVLNKQAKRAISKMEKAGYTPSVSNRFEQIFQFVSTSLNGKFRGINTVSLGRLQSGLKAAQYNGKLTLFQVDDPNGNLQGGLVCLENDHQLLYMKGTAAPGAMKHGAMYGLMYKAMQYAFDKGKFFDFGGSRMEGVRRFNLNLGGKDISYYHFVANHGPFWFNILRNVNVKLKKSGLKVNP